MKRLSLFPMLLLGLLIFERASLGADSPSLLASNVRAIQRGGTNLVDIWYDVAYAGTDQLYAAVAVSTNSGVTFDLPAVAFTPANGVVITPGSNRQIVWNAGEDWNGNFSSQVKFRITVSDVNTNGPLAVICRCGPNAKATSSEYQTAAGGDVFVIAIVSGGIPPYTCAWSIAGATNLIPSFTHTNIPPTDSFTLPTALLPAGTYLPTAQVTDFGSNVATGACTVHITTSGEGEK